VQRVFQTRKSYAKLYGKDRLVFTDQHLEYTNGAYGLEILDYSEITKVVIWINKSKQITDIYLFLNRGDRVESLKQFEELDKLALAFQTFTPRIVENKINPRGWTVGCTILFICSGLFLFWLLSYLNL
jgi:hypothetical protein